MRAAALIALGLVASPAAAEGQPDFDICFSRAIAQFEAGFARSGQARAPEDFAAVTRDAVHHCGTLAILACDRGQAPHACQRVLAERQGALTERVLQGLPPPGAVAPSAPLPGLYPQLWAIAHGSLAGDDCAGADAPVAAWCEAHLARLKLTEAVALWQVGRLIGAAGPAVELGWVAEARPLAPIPRPDREGRR